MSVKELWAFGKQKEKRMLAPSSVVAAGIYNNNLVCDGKKNCFNVITGPTRLYNFYLISRMDSFYRLHRVERPVLHSLHIMVSVDQRKRQMQNNNCSFDNVFGHYPNDSSSCAR